MFPGAIGVLEKMEHSAGHQPLDLSDGDMELSGNLRIAEVPVPRAFEHRSLGLGHGVEEAAKFAKLGVHGHSPSGRPLPGEEIERARDGGGAHPTGRNAVKDMGRRPMLRPAGAGQAGLARQRLACCGDDHRRR